MIPKRAFRQKAISRIWRSLFMMEWGRLLCCKLLQNYSVITVYPVIYCHVDSNTGYWPSDITEFWKVIWLAYENLDSVKFIFSSVIGRFRNSNLTWPCGTQLCLTLMLPHWLPLNLPPPTHSGWTHNQLYLLSQVNFSLPLLPPACVY